MGADKKAELVLLDHGLYDSLNESHRRALCYLYKAIIMKDEPAMDYNSSQLGVEGNQFITQVYLEWNMKYITLV